MVGTPKDKDDEARRCGTAEAEDVSMSRVLSGTYEGAGGYVMLSELCLGGDNADVRKLDRLSMKLVLGRHGLVLECVEIHKGELVCCQE